MISSNIIVLRKYFSGIFALSICPRNRNMKTRLCTAVLLVLGLVTVAQPSRQEDEQKGKFICWAYDQHSGELRIHTDEEMDHPSFTSQVHCQKISHPYWENYSTEDLKLYARNALEKAKAVDSNNSNNFTAPIKRSGLDLHEL